MPVTSPTVIEINQTGIASDNNGGGFDPTLGTVDYTYGPNAQAISVSNIQINDSNNTQIYSSSRPFVANDVGNTIYIRGGTERKEPSRADAAVHLDACHRSCARRPRISLPAIGG